MFRRKAKAASDIGIQCSHEGGQCRISLSGRITHDSAPDLRVALLGRLKDLNSQDLTVDLDEITYIDTSGLAILIEVLKAARSQGKTFHLSHVQEQPRSLLEATRLLHFFDTQSPEVPQASHSDSQVSA